MDTSERRLGKLLRAVNLMENQIGGLQLELLDCIQRLENVGKALASGKPELAAELAAQSVWEFRQLAAKCVPPAD